jgi:dienelactone hydrolase
MTSELFLTNGRGLKLSTILSIPENAIKSPIVLLLQGFLGKKDGTKLNSISEELLSKGIATIRFDYAGYGKSQGKAETEYLISNMLKDIDLILDFVKANDKIDSSRIGIWGQSMGGMLALLTASSHNEIKLVCAVSSPPTITLNDDLENKINEWKEKGFLERFNSNGNLIKITYKFVEDARKWNAIKEVTKINSPKLFIVDTDDTTVQPKSTIEIFDAASGIKELLKIDGMLK